MSPAKHNRETRKVHILNATRSLVENTDLSFKIRERENSNYLIDEILCGFYNVLDFDRRKNLNSNSFDRLLCGPHQTSPAKYFSSVCPLRRPLWTTQSHTMLHNATPGPRHNHNHIKSTETMIKDRPSTINSKLP